MREHRLHEQFASLDRQVHAARFGMWLFLGSELLLFAGLFALYAAYRVMYPAEFVAAAHHSDVALGTLNTFVLVTSSFPVALAVHAIRGGRARLAALHLVLAMLLGGVFLVVKGIEYSSHFADGIAPGPLMDPGLAGPQQLFFQLYYAMTGLHALHVVAGLGILGWVAVRAWRGAYSPRWHVPLELGGLYWHLVDLVWVFLWPLFYLMR